MKYINLFIAENETDAGYKILCEASPVGIDDATTMMGLVCYEIAQRIESNLNIPAAAVLGMIKGTIDELLGKKDIKRKEMKENG